MIDLILSAFFYIINDPYFWGTMAFTSMVGIFIGAVIYNGDVNQIKKFLASLGSYCILILSVNLSRIIPQIKDLEPSVSPQPFASSITIILVTLFYLLGMGIGIYLVRKVHKKINV